MAVQALADQGLDDCLSADVQLLCGSIQLFEHGGGEIDVHSLNRLHHPAGVGEKARNIFSLVCQAGNGFSRSPLCFPTSGSYSVPIGVHDRASFPPRLISIASPSGGIHLPHPGESRRSQNIISHRPSRSRGTAPKSSRANRANPNSQGSPALAIIRFHTSDSTYISRSS